MLIIYKFLFLNTSQIEYQLDYELLHKMQIVNIN